MTEDDFFAAAEGPKRPPIRVDADHNRRLIAERTGWPQGALDECVRLERQFRGWVVCWLPTWTVPDFEREEGFYAWLVGDQPLVKTSHGGYARRRELYGVDAAALEKELAKQP